VPSSLGFIHQHDTLPYNSEGSLIVFLRIFFQKLIVFPVQPRNSTYSKSVIWFKCYMLSRSLPMRHPAPLWLKLDVGFIGQFLLIKVKVGSWKTSVWFEEVASPSNLSCTHPPIQSMRYIKFIPFGAQLVRVGIGSSWEGALTWFKYVVQIVLLFVEFILLFVDSM
jgi:hypothetical protein